MKVLTSSVYPTRFGNAQQAPEKPVATSRPTSEAAPSGASVPVSSLKAYTLFGQKPALPKFGATLPGFDLHNFMENDELDFRVSRLYQQAMQSARGEEVTPEDLVLAILKDYLEDAQPDSQHGSSFLGQVLGLHGNADKFLNSEAGQATVSAVREAVNELEAHLKKEASATSPRNKSASMELLKDLAQANQAWQSIKKSTFNPEDMPAFMDEDILLQVFARHNQGKAGEVVRKLTQALALQKQFDITPHTGESDIQNIDTEQTTNQNAFADVLTPLNGETLSEERLGKPAIQGQHAAFQVLEQVLNSTLQAGTLSQLGVRPTTSALLVGGSGLGKSDLVTEFAQKNNIDAVFCLDGKALAKKSQPEILQAIRHTYDQARERAEELKAEGKQPRVLVFFDNLETKPAAQGPEQAPTSPLAAYFLQSIKEPSLHAEGVMTVGATTNSEELQKVPTLNLPMLTVQMAAPQLPGEQAKVVRELAKAFNHKSGQDIFAANLDYESLATRFIGANGRDLNTVLGQAIELALLEQGNSADLKVENRHLQAAADFKSIGVQNRQVLETMSEDKKRLIAYHELGHALGQLVMNRILGTSDSDVERLTIVPQGGALGFTSVRATGNRYESSQSSIFAQLVKTLASIPAEKLFSNEMHTTPKHDLESANQLAFQYVAQLGMGKNKVLYQPGQPVAEGVEREVNELLNTGEKVATALLNPLAPLIKELAEEVLSKETVSGEFLNGRLDTYLEQNPKAFRRMKRSTLKILSQAGLFPERIQRTGLLRRRTLVASPFSEATSKNVSTKESKE